MPDTILYASFYEKGSEQYSNNHEKTVIEWLQKKYMKNNIILSDFYKYNLKHQRYIFSSEQKLKLTEYIHAASNLK